MAGCSVLTRPSSISGKLVISLTSRTATAAARSALAVPPVEMRLQPSLVKPRAKSTTPVLSETESSAVGISDGTLRLELLQDRNHLYRARINHVLDVQNSRCQRFGRIGFVDSHAPLRDDRATIVILVHEMNGHARFLRSRGDYGFVNARAVHAFAAKCGQQGGVDVHDSPGVLTDHPRRNPLHVAAQHHEI